MIGRPTGFAVWTVIFFLPLPLALHDAGVASTKYRRILPHLPNQLVHLLSAPAAGTALPQHCLLSYAIVVDRIYICSIRLDRLDCIITTPVGDGSSAAWRPHNATLPGLAFNGPFNSRKQQRTLCRPEMSIPLHPPISCPALSRHGSLSTRYCRHRRDCSQDDMCYLLSTPCTLPYKLWAFVPKTSLSYSRHYGPPSKPIDRLTLHNSFLFGLLT